MYLRVTPDVKKLDGFCDRLIVLLRVASLMYQSFVIWFLLREGLGHGNNVWFQHILVLTY